MNTLSIILLVIIAIAFVAAVWAIVVKKSGQCKGCSGGSKCQGCPYNEL